MPSGEPGVCVEWSKCEPIYAELKKGTKTRDDLVLCFTPGDEEEPICCPKRKKDDFPIPIDEKHQTQGKREADKVCGEYKTAYSGLPMMVEYHILNGDNTTLGEFPHMAAIGYVNLVAGETMLEFRCGGSLISNQYVMTAAHCVERLDPPPSIIRLGTISLNEHPENARDFGVESVILHPEYKSSRKYHDIALIRLNTTVPLESRKIFPACLDTDTDIKSNIELLATGWGRTELATNKISDILLKGTLRTVSRSTCNTQFKAHNPQDINLPDGLLDGQICADDPNKQQDTCQGDSGGPLQINVHEQVAKIIGVTQYGLFCGPPLPSVYTRVSFYLDWLEKEVWRNVV